MLREQNRTASHESKWSIVSLSTRDLSVLMGFQIAPQRNLEPHPILFRRESTPQAVVNLKRGQAIGKEHAFA